METLNALWERITAPYRNMEQRDGRQAQFLASLLLFFLLAGGFFQAIFIIVSPPELRLPLILAGAFGAGILLMLYHLSRTTHYRRAAMLTALVMAFLIFVNAYFVDEPALVLMYLVVPVLLGAVFVSLRTAATLTVLAGAGLVLILLGTANDDTQLLLAMFAFYSVTSGLLLISAYQQRRMARQRWQQLAENEARLRTYFEEASDWVFTLDADGRINSVNRKMIRSSGYSASELLGQHPSKFFNDEHSEYVERLLQDFREGGGVEQVELKVPLRNGRHIWLEVRGGILQDEGQFQGTFHIARDVTERRLAEESEREQRVLAEALRDTATALNSTLDLDQVLERILENVGRVVPHDGANIMLVEDDLARVVRSTGYAQSEGGAAKVNDLSFVVHQTRNFHTMAQTGQPCVIPDTNAEPEWTVLPQTSWVQSYVGAPISRGGEVIGFLNLDSSQPNFFTELHAERLQAFADQVAIALQNAQLFQALESYNEALEQAVNKRTVELRRAMDQVEVILNNSPDAILLLRLDGTIQTANPAFFEMFGIMPNQLSEQQPVQSLVSPASLDLFEEALHAVLVRGKKRRLELEAQRENGGPFDADLALAPVKEEDVVRGGVVSVRDISTLKEVDRMKDAFVSNVSHELRTPITSLRLYHDLLVRNPQRSEVYLERLEREINRLNGIIEDLLRLSRLDRGRLDVTMERVDLDELVGQYVHDRRPLANRSGLSLQWIPSGSPAIVEADPGLLEQVVGILLTNALNYTPEGGDITIKVERGQQDGKEGVVFSVCDTGRGITPEEQRHLFDRFFRGGAAQESGTPGTGLGLAIAREIIQRHNGSIEVSSEGVPGKGSEFRVWLPGGQ
jgi:PAS domain S-box-containing protein